MLKNKAIVLVASLSGWGALTFAVSRLIDLSPMMKRLVVLLYTASNGKISIGQGHACFAGSLLGAVVAGAILEIVMNEKHKANPYVSAMFGSVFTIGVLATVHYVCGMFTSRGHFYEFSPSMVEIMAIPVLGGLFYLAVRLPLFGFADERGDEVRRGVTILTNGKAALRAFKKEAKHHGALGARLHPQLRLPRDVETKHILIVAAPGAGKTQVMFPMLADIVERGEPVILYDFKGDYTQAYGEAPGTLILSPFDARGVAWDMAADLDTDIRVAEFAASLMPHRGTKDPFFKKSAQDVLTAVIVRLQHEKGVSWTLADLVGILNDQSEVLKACKLYRPGAVSAIGDGTSTQGLGVLAELRTGTVQLEYLARAWSDAETKFSVTAWAQNERRRQEHRIIIIQGNQKYRELAGFLTNVIFSIFIKDVLSLPDSRERAMWAFLDEFGNLPAIEGIDTMLTAVRSKGLRVVAAIQNFGQVEEAYSPAFGKTFIDNFGTVLAGHSTGDTATRLSNYFGRNQMEREVSSKSRSHGGEKGSRRTDSTGQQIVVENALLDTDFSTIKPPSARRPATFWLKVAGWPVGKLLYPVKPTPAHYESRIDAAWLSRRTEPRAHTPQTTPVAPAAPVIVNKMATREHEHERE